MDAKKDTSKVEAKMTVEMRRQVASEPEPVGHVATGYANLDMLLYGGLPPNFAVALTSPSCDERDSLIKSFLEAGTKEGQITFYITAEAGGAQVLAKEFQSNFYLFVCNPRADVMVKNLPNVFKLKGVENLTDIDIVLTKSFRMLDASRSGPRRVCIEIISDVLLQHHAVITRKWLTELITELKSARFTTLAVIDPQMHSSEELHAILGLFDGEINICERQTEKGLERFLKIKRMSNQKYMKNETVLVVTVTLVGPTKVFNICDFAAFLYKRGIKAFDPVSGILKLGSQEICITDEGVVDGPEPLKLRAEKWIEEFMSS
jgi:KaiC/GvpD/RAD55 family RecA-like ATPase